MKYFKTYKYKAETKEITREEARTTLDGYWKEEALNDIFNNSKSFRLFTPYSEVWTKTDDGTVPIAGFYGIVG